MGLRQVIKMALPAPARAALRKEIKETSEAIDSALEAVGRRGLRVWRSLKLEPPKPSLAFAMLCIRRPVYVDLALASINSLHYHNSAHCVRLYLDSVCTKAYDAAKRKLDYPDRVTPVLVDYDPETPWQFKKMDVVMDAFSRGFAFVDADSRWHSDPASVLDADHASFLVVVNTFRTVDAERTLISEVLHKPEWLDLRHFNTGFLSVPKKLFTNRLSETCRSLAREIYAAAEGPQFTGEQSRMLKHTAEEISLSIGTQLVIGGDNIRTLKTQDGPGNRNILESYYYGALNGAV
jgi:hypothetical protein